MKKTAVSEYGFINAKLRAKISTILTEDFIHALSDAGSIAEVIQVLEEYGFTSVSESWRKTADLQNVEFELFKGYIGSYRTVMKNTDGIVHSFVNSLSIKPEIENIKSVLRLWYGSKIRKRPIGHRASYIYRSRIYEKIDWDALINAIEWSDIVSVFENTIYSEIFNSETINDDSDSLFNIETSLDRLYYSHIIEQNKKLRAADNKTVTKIITTEIDLQNVSWLIRYRHFYKMDFKKLKDIIIPGGSSLQLENLRKDSDESGGIAPSDLLYKSYPELSALRITDKHNFAEQAVLFEHLLDETRKREFTKILGGYPFTIGIVLVFFFMSERELKYISSVLNGKNYGLTGDRIKEIVR